MDLPAQIDQFKLNAQASAWLASTCAQWQNEAAHLQADLTHKTAELKLAHLQIQALTLELAQHKRLR